MVAHLQQVHPADGRRKAALVAVVVIQIAGEEHPRAVFLDQEPHALVVFAHLFLILGVDGVEQRESEVAEGEGLVAQLRYDRHTAGVQRFHHLVVYLLVIPLHDLIFADLRGVVPLQVRPVHGHVRVRNDGIEAADMVGMTVGAQHEIQMHLAVFVRRVGLQVGEHLLLEAGQVQAREITGIIGILARVHHGEMAVALQQDRVRGAGGQKMDAVPARFGGLRRGGQQSRIQLFSQALFGSRAMQGDGSRSNSPANRHCGRGDQNRFFVHSGFLLCARHTHTIPQSATEVHKKRFRTDFCVKEFKFQFVGERFGSTR